MANPAKLLETSLLVIWNDRDAHRRLAEMKKTYTPDVHFYEFHTATPVVEHEAINELIAKLQSDWPPESRFVLNKPSQVNHAVQLASWNLGPQGVPPIAAGTDVALIENDLIKAFYLYLDDLVTS
jgi:hypothetical protein